MDIVIKKVAIVMAMMLLLTVAPGACEPALSNQYGVPGVSGNFGNGHHGGGSSGSSGSAGVTNSYGAPVGTGYDANQDYIDSQPKSYEFGYAVKDSATGNDFGRQETSDGETVRGEYRVQLPDGRTQIVTYTADWRTGFHADVRYEGVATYPEQYNTNNGYNNGYNNVYNNNGGSNGYDIQGNSIDSGYTGGNSANYNANYNNYQSNNGGYNYNGNNNPYQQYATNSLGNNNQGYNNGFGSFGAKTPSSSYGTPNFHRK